jgi:hypothetical protein
MRSCLFPPSEILESQDKENLFAFYLLEAELPAFKIAAFNPFGTIAIENLMRTEEPFTRTGSGTPESSPLFPG